MGSGWRVRKPRRRRTKEINSGSEETSLKQNRETPSTSALSIPDVAVELPPPDSNINLKVHRMNMKLCLYYNLCMVIDWRVTNDVVCRWAMKRRPRRTRSSRCIPPEERRVVGVTKTRKPSSCSAPTFLPVIRTLFEAFDLTRMTWLEDPVRRKSNQSPIWVFYKYISRSCFENFGLTIC